VDKYEYRFIWESHVYLCEAYNITCTGTDSTYKLYDAVREINGQVIKEVILPVAATCIEVS